MELVTRRLEALGNLEFQLFNMSTADVVLVCGLDQQDEFGKPIPGTGKEEFYTHCAVLAAKSEYFFESLASVIRESDNKAKKLIGEEKEGESATRDKASSELAVNSFSVLETAKSRLTLTYPDIQPTHMRSLLIFLYESKSSIMPVELSHVYKIAEDFKFEGVKSAIKQVRARTCLAYQLNDYALQKPQYVSHVYA